MNDILKNNLDISISKKTTSIMWIGQAGFIITTDGGAKIAADLYLSDCCERCFGFRRQMASPFFPSEIRFDAVLATHSHYDHFDIDSMPWLLSGNTTQLVCAKDCIEECERLKLNKDNIKVIGVGEKTETAGITLEAVPCDHGKLAPDAVGLLLAIAGKRIYIMGDTAYRPEWLDRPGINQPELLILPINGAYGNLNEEQAALVVSHLRPRLTIPCHYGMFAEHGGDVRLFEEAMNRISPELSYEIPTVGKAIHIAGDAL